MAYKINFSDDFLFTDFCFSKLFHNDSRKYGSAGHYIGYMRQGSGRLISKEAELSVSAGDVFYIPQGLQYHSYWIPQTGGTAHFDSYRFQLFPGTEEREYVLQKIDANEAARRELEALAADRRVSVSSLGHLYSFLGMVVPQMCCRAAPRQETLIGRAEQYMRDHLFERYSLAQLASHCHVSESTLYAAFQQYRGHTPGGWRRRMLCDKAKDLLLTTDLAVGEISEMLGFSSASYFRKVFFKECQCTPRQVRREKKTM